MNLSQLLAGGLPGVESLQQFALVFSPQMAQRLVNVQAWFGDSRFLANPVATSDGQWFLCADILVECLSPPGVYYPGFALLDASRFDEIAVVPWENVTPANPPLAPPEPEPKPA